MTESEERAEEENNEGQSNISTSSLLLKSAEKLSFEYNKTTTLEGSNKSTHEQLRVDSYTYNLEQREKEDNLFAFRPIEIFERNILHNLHMHQEEEEEQKTQQQKSTLFVPPTSDDANLSPFSAPKLEEKSAFFSLQIPTLVLPTFEKPPPDSDTEDVYVNENIPTVELEPVRVLE